MAFFGYVCYNELGKTGIQRKGELRMELRISEYLSNIKEYDGAMLSADLRCACGADEFQFFHTGKQTKGIFSALIVQKNKQLTVNAVCPRCNCSIIVFDSAKDGAKPKEKEYPDDFTAFASGKIPGQFPVRIKYNYEPEHFKTNRFENCFIYIVGRDGKEKHALIEE